MKEKRMRGASQVDKFRLLVVFEITECHFIVNFCRLPRLDKTIHRCRTMPMIDPPFLCRNESLHGQLAKYFFR